MSIFDPSAMDTVFEDLENELGETIMDVIIEAQRRFGKANMNAEGWKRSGYDFKSWAAIRGLGNITHFKADEKRLALTVENPCMHLAQIGTAQALYELAWGAENSKHEWYRSADGDLHIEVSLS